MNNRIFKKFRQSTNSGGWNKLAINIRLYFQTISRTMFSFMQHFFLFILLVCMLQLARFYLHQSAETEKQRQRFLYFFVHLYFNSFIFSSKLSWIAVVGSLSVTPSYHDSLYAKLPIMSNDIIHDLFTTNQFCENITICLFIVFRCVSNTKHVNFKCHSAFLVLFDVIFAHFCHS